MVVYNRKIAARRQGMKKKGITSAMQKCICLNKWQNLLEPDDINKNKSVSE